MLYFFILLMVLVLALAITGAKIYNQLVCGQNQVANCLAQINVVLSKRYDLIPNLVATAQRYMEHENDTFIKVTEARNNASALLKTIGADSSNLSTVLPQLVSAEGVLSSALGGLSVQIENYPELKADEQMLNLQSELSNLETELAESRSRYNLAVTEFNNLAQTFPNNVISKYFNFRPTKWLEIENIEEKKEAVKVDFS